MTIQQRKATFGYGPARTGGGSLIQRLIRHLGSSAGKYARAGAILTTVTIAVCAVLSAQTGTTGADPMGGHLTQFRSDHIFATIPPTAANSGNTGFTTLGATYPASQSDSITFNDTQYSTTVPYAGLRQYHAASGRILQPDHDDMVVVNGDGSNVDVQIVGHPELNVTLPNLLSRYSISYANKPLTVDFVAVAVGDLDRATDSNGNYHDEVVIAYVQNNGTMGPDGEPIGPVVLVVLDYSKSVSYPNGYPNQNGVTYTPPTITHYTDAHFFYPTDLVQTLPAPAVQGLTLPFDNMLSVSVGDYDGDGANEIALGVVDLGFGVLTDGVSVETFRYRSEFSTPLIVFMGGLDVPTRPVNGQPSHTALNISTASGDFEDKGHDDLALGFLEWNTTVSNIPLLPGAGGAGSFPINILSGPATQQQTSITVAPGNPTQLVINVPDGEVPHQLTISGAPCTSYNPWCALNGSWRATEVSRTSDGIGTFAIPLDSSAITTAAPTTLALSLSSALAPIPNSSTYALLNPSDSSQPAYNNSFNLAVVDSYPRVQLVSGLFRLDPANGYTFTRREFAAVYTYPQFCVLQSGNSNCGPLGNSVPDSRLFLGYFSAVPDDNSVPQIQNYRTAWFYPPTEGAQVAHRWDVAAGAFRGNAAVPADTSSPAFVVPPIWSVAVNAWYGNHTDYIFVDEYHAASGPNPDQNFYGAQSYAVNLVNFGDRPAIAAYDPDGESDYLGAPVHFTVPNLISPIRILEEPAKHTAWLKGAIFNLSRNDGFYTAFTDTEGKSMTSSSTATASHDFAASEAATFSLQVKSDIGAVQNKFNFSEELKFGQQRHNIETSFNSQAASLTFNSTTRATQDDYLDFELQNLDVWRYRVYGASGTNQPAGQYPYYELTFPSGFVQASAPGTKVDWYNPVHENGNLLSYPPLPQGNVPDDVSATPYTVNGQPIGSNGMISGSCNGPSCTVNGYCIATGTATTQSIDMTGVTDSTSTVGWTKTNTYETDTKIGDQVKFNYANINTVKAGVQLDLDFGWNQSWSQTDSTDNTITGSQSVVFQQDLSSESYWDYPVLYNSTAGVLKFVQYVGIPTAGGGTSSCQSNYWTQTYGTAPDPALNLPNRFTWAGYDATTDTTTWTVNQTLEREKVRGFSINKFSALENGYFPIGSNPQEGDKVQLAVRVYNYSVGANPANSVTVKFFVAPYDSSHDNELNCGVPGATETGRYCSPVTRIWLGSTIIPSIPSWGQQGQNWQLATYDWTIPNDFATMYKTSEFRIYMSVEGYPGELNPPQKFCTDIAGDKPCPTTIGTVSTDANWDPLAPGQNNEGYAPTILTVTPPILQSVPPGGGVQRSNVKVSGDSLQAVNLSGKLQGGLVVAYLGRPLPLRVKATVDGAPIQNEQQVYVYDGTGTKRTMIAGKMLPGITAAGSHAWLNWTPTSLGLHEVTAEFTTSSTNLSQGTIAASLKVIVTRIPGDVNGDGFVDARDAAILTSQIGKKVSESSCGSACDINGDGVIGRSDLDLLLANCDHAHCAVAPVADRRKQAGHMK